MFRLFAAVPFSVRGLGLAPFGISSDVKLARKCINAAGNVVAPLVSMQYGYTGSRTINEFACRGCMAEIIVSRVIGGIENPSDRAV